MLVGLIRTEVDRAAGRLGFVREEELAAVRRHVARLETQLGEVRDRMGAPAPSSPATPESAEVPEPPAADEPPAAPAGAADPAAPAASDAETGTGSGPTPGIPVKPRKKKIPVAPQEDA
jgi:nucleoid-associated protein YgaU